MTPEREGETMIKSSRLLVAGPVIVLGCLLFVLLYSTARASFCSAREDGLQAAEVIFSGKVSNITSEQGDDVVTLRILRVWKGETEAQAVVHTGDTARDCGKGPCGYQFKRGQSYLVFAYKWPAIPHFDMGGSLTIPAGVPTLLMTDLCSRTAPLATAYDDLAALGPGTLPATGSESVARAKDLISYLVAGIALIAGGAGLRLLVAARRKDGMQ
jgi:hypothetical protein